MAIKKSQLYSAIWDSCDALRGSMDASQYKNYVLMILFVKYLSDKAKRGGTRLIVPEGCYFEDFVELKQSSTIGEDINKKLEAIREANIKVIGSIDLPNFNHPTQFGEAKDKVKTLSDLIGVFQRDELDFSKNRANNDDILGDAYEYLMKNFAAESGKSKGQFYTPAEVSRVIAQILNLKEFQRASNTIYDPTCGSGSLLLRAQSYTANGNVSLYGQEMDDQTVTLAKLNMLLHGIQNPHIEKGDTINNPKFKNAGGLETFDICVANPPFSKKKWLGDAGEDDIYHRWSAELCPPKKNGDYAFLLHLISSMKEDTGRGACILPHGVLFRGNAEAAIRQSLIEKNCFIEGIIGLPQNVFFGTGIPACIVVINKKDASSRKGIFMIDAKEGFKKDGNKNRLREQDIRKIVDTWKAKKDVPHYARFVPLSEIKENEYNLNIPRYIAAVDKEIKQNISAHLNGGLPAYDIDEQMENYWDILPSLKPELFKTSRFDSSRYDLIPKKDEIRNVIQENKDFNIQREAFNKTRDSWYSEVRSTLEAFKQNSNPKPLGEYLGDSVLSAFSNNTSLVDSYGVYDILMNYWNDSLQDDCYIIKADGWKAEYVNTKKKPATVGDIECDLLPVSIVVNEFFASEKSAISAKESEVAEKESEKESAEENILTIEDLEDLAYIINEEDEEKVLKSDAELKKLSKDSSVSADNKKLIADYLSIKDVLKKCKAELKALNLQLLENVKAKYNSLKEDETKKLVIEKKWFATLAENMITELQNVVQQIVTEVTDLQERYECTLDELEANCNTLSKKVAVYLKELE